MIGTIIWLIGLVCAIWCVMDIFKKNISTGGKVIASIIGCSPVGWDLRSTISTAATIWKSGSGNCRNRLLGERATGPAEVPSLFFCRSNMPRISARGVFPYSKSVFFIIFFSIHLNGCTIIFNRFPEWIRSIYRSFA